MIPQVLKTANLAPLRADRLALHEIACSHAEEQFCRRGEIPPTWLVATGPQVAWIETPFEEPNDKRHATWMIRNMLEEMKAQAYSFISEVWVGAFSGEMSEEERKHWMAFSNEHGVCALPPELRDDALMVISHDRAGSFSIAKYLVTLRKGKGPNFLGPRMDEGDQLTGIAGPMFNLFQPEQPIKSEAMRGTRQ